MPAQTTRPSDEELRHFLLGSLPVDRAAVVASWVAESQDAPETLHNLGATDTLTGALADTTQIVLPRADEVERVVAAARGLTTRGELTQADSLPLPMRFGPYRVLRELGRGGMGVVYEARDEQLGRNVAVKVMGPSAAASETARDRFLREARTAASISHDHIVTVHHVGEEAGVPYIAMPLLAGQSLDDRMRAGPITMAEAVRIGREVAEGLAAAHAVGLTHRDIKPANLWLEGPRGRVKVLDFGLARSVREGETLTRSGLVVGTPAYMAPEQAAGKKVDHRADLFSLGAVLYAMVTGRRPFEGTDVMAVLSSLATEIPPTAATLNPTVPPALSDLIDQLLAKDPTRRPASADDVARELAQIEFAAAPRLATSDLTTAIMPVVSAPASRKRFPKTAVRVAAGLIGLAAVVTLGVIIIRDKDGKKIAEVPYYPEKGQTVEIDPKGNAEIPPAKAGPAVVMPVPAGASPFDKLDPKAIPAAERFDWQPKELVAVIGSHRQRLPYGASMLACSPDGKIVVADGYLFPTGLDGSRVSWPENGETLFVADDKALSRGKAWDLSGNRPKALGKLPPGASHFGPARPDKLVLAWADYPEKPELVLLDTSDMTQVKELVRLPGAHSGSLSPDGKLLAALDAKDKVLTLHDWDGKKLSRRITTIEHGGFGGYFISPFTFMGDGHLGVCHQDGVFRVWDVRGPEPKTLAETSKHELGGGPWWPVVSPDGKSVALCHQSYARIWRFEGNRLVELTGITSFDLGLDRSNTSCVAFRTNETLVVGHIGGAISQWDLKKKPAQQINPLRGNVASKFEVSPDGATLVAIGEDSRVQKFALGGVSPKPMPLDESWSGRHGLTQGLITPDASHVLYGDEVLSLDEREPAWKKLPVKAREVGPLNRMVFTVDGKHVLLITAVTRPSARMAVAPFSADLGKGISEWTMVLPGPDDSLILPGGKHIVNPVEDGKVYLYANSGGKITKTDEVLARANSTYHWAATRDGKTIVLVGSNEPLWFEIEKDRFKPLKPFDNWRVDASGACFSPDDKQVCLYGSSVQVFDRASGKLLHDWKWLSAPNRVRRVLYAPDGRHLLVNNFDGTLYVLRLKP